VLVLEGDKWASDPLQVQRLRTFLDQHLPLRYRSSDNAGPDVFTVDYMTAEDGDELAVIVRTGPMGQPSRKLDVELNWSKAHSKLTLLDPFALGPWSSRAQDASGASEAKVTMEGFQDVLLVLAR
jgi:hypothetical protein